MKITVTEEHIRNGKRCIAHTCPLALALMDAGFESAAVTHSIVLLSTEKSMIAINLPRDVRDKLILFDSGDQMEPFEFELEDAC